MSSRTGISFICWNSPVNPIVSSIELLIARWNFSPSASRYQEVWVQVRHFGNLIMMIVEVLRGVEDVVIVTSMEKTLLSCEMTQSIQYYCPTSIAAWILVMMCCARTVSPWCTVALLLVSGSEERFPYGGTSILSFTNVSTECMLSRLSMLPMLHRGIIMLSLQECIIYCQCQRYWNHTRRPNSLSQSLSSLERIFRALLS